MAANSRRLSSPHAAVLAFLFTALVISTLQAEEPLPAATRKAWTLGEISAIAEQASPDLRQAAEEVEIQRGKARQAGLYPNPELSGGTNQLGGDQTQVFSMLSQEIVTKGKLKLTTAAALKDLTQAEVRFVRTRFDLLTNVRLFFYSGLAAQRRVDVLTKLVVIAKRSAQAALDLEKADQGARGDTLLLEIELDRARLALRNAEAQLLAAQRQLASAAGDPDLVIEDFAADLDEKLPDYAFENARGGILAQNSLIHAAEAEVQRNQILLRRAEVEPFPNVTLQGGYMYEVQRPHNLAILQFSVPIPVWNRNQGNIYAARASIGKSIETVRKTQVDLTRQLAAAIGRFQVANEQAIEFQTNILPKAQESVRISQVGFQQGHLDLFRVLQSQRALADSQISYIAAQESRWTAAAEIAGLTQEEVFPVPVLVPAELPHSEGPQPVQTPRRPGRTP